MIRVIPILFACLIQECVGAWVTVGLSSEDTNNIFLTARNKGRSNAELMLIWSEENKGDICKSVLTASSLAAQGITYIEKMDTSNARLVFELNRKIFDKHYTKDENKVVEPIYPVEPRDVIVGEELYDVFGFPCLATVDDKYREVYIADGYLEKTYMLLTSALNDPESPSEERTLSIMGFAEIPPDRESAKDPLTLEESYYASLEARQVATFLNWDEHESLINPVKALHENEKLKLCSLAFDAVHLDFGWEISNTKQFRIKDFEHVPVSFTVLKKKPPIVPPRHQILRGIECIAETDKYGRTVIDDTIHFILIPNWLNKDSVFALRYSDSVAPAPIVPEPWNSTKQAKGSRRSTNNQAEASTSAAERSLQHEIVADDREAVVLISHLQSVSFMTNQRNGIHVTLFS